MFRGRGRVRGRGRGRGRGRVREDKGVGEELEKIRVIFRNYANEV